TCLHRRGAGVGAGRAARDRARRWRSTRTRGLSEGRSFRSGRGSRAGTPAIPVSPAASLINPVLRKALENLDLGALMAALIDHRDGPRDECGVFGIYAPEHD